MNIKIFEDQTGSMLFPEKGYDKNVVRFFDNKIDLYVRRIENNLEISCYVLIYKGKEGQERAIGSYIIGEDKYTDNIFTNFKKNANDALRSIGFKPKSDNVENAIFDNIEKFDLDGNTNEDIKILSKILELNSLNYNAGDVKDIAIFCKKLLENTKRLKIAISTEKSNIGDINILRNKKYQEHLVPTNESKNIIDTQRKKIAQTLVIEQTRIIEEKKRIEGDVGNKKINDGMESIKEGLKIKRNSDLVVDKDIERINEIVGNYKKRIEEKEKLDSHISNKTIVIVGIIMLMSGLITGVIFSDIIKNTISTFSHPSESLANNSSGININVTANVTSMPSHNATPTHIQTTNNGSTDTGNGTINGTINVTGNGTINITGNGTINVTGNGTETNVNDSNLNVSPSHTNTPINSGANMSVDIPVLIVDS